MSGESSDPSLSTNLSRLSFDHPIPKAVRDYGKALDPSILEAGDLLLVSHKYPSWSGQLIRYYQGKLFDSEHAKWQHAAVSGGRFEICEATLSGVQAKMYWDYMTGNYDVKVRRLKGATTDERSKVAYFAATNVRSGYAYLTALNMRAVLGRADAWQRPLIRSSGVICSQLYFEACMRVGYLLVNVPSENVCPAHLSMTPHLEDVPLHWVEV